MVVELLPQALEIVKQAITARYPQTRFVQRMSTGKIGALISDNGNLLADVYFEAFPDLEQLDIQVKMLPGVVGHSLFFQMAQQAVIAGEEGVKYIYPAVNHQVNG